MLAAVRRSHTALGFFALAGLAATAIQGLGVEAGRRIDLPHLAMGVAALLLVLLGHAWYALYLGVLGRSLGSSGSPVAALDEAPLARVASLRRRGLPWAAMVLVLVVLTATGGALPSNWLPLNVHGWLAWATVVAQGLSVVVANRGLRSLDHDLQAWESRASAP